MSKKPREYPAQAYCGCCGREISGGSWCADCLGHLLPRAGRYEYERTYFAQYNQPCPFEWPAQGEGKEAK